MQNKTKQLIDELETGQQQITGLLETAADDQDWRPASGEWSFRDVATHLAVVDKECFLDRVTRIASGENPHFDYYSHTDWDFGQFDLRNSLRQWAANRREIIDFVTGLPEDKLTLTGTHETAGEITVPDVLQTMLDHDKEHQQELEQTIAAHQMASRCQKEINELHQFFQDWFNGTIAPTDENFARLLTVVGDSFTIISPGGILTEREPLLTGLRNAHNARNQCKIWIENFQFRRLEGKVAVTTYEEWQQGADGITTTRISTALFKEDATAPNGVVWLHVHETWLAR